MAETKQRQSKWYTSRGANRAFMGVDSAVTDKDNRRDALIAQASRFVERYTEREFLPELATRYFTPHTKDTLFVDDLLSVTSIKDDDDGDRTYDNTWASTDYDLLPFDGGTDKPYIRIELTPESDQAFAPTVARSIEIVGEWGYSKITYDSTTINEGGQFTDSDTTLTVSDASEIEVGDTLLIESEQMWVRDKSTNDLTVDRGVNGTTAAAHGNGTTVSVIYPPDDIRFAVNTLVARWMHRSDTAFADRTGSAEQGFFFVQSVPTEVKAILDQYRKLGVSVL